MPRTKESVEKLAVMLRLEPLLAEQLDLVVRHGAFGGNRAEVLMGVIRKVMPEMLGQVRDAQEAMRSIRENAQRSRGDK